MDAQTSPSSELQDALLRRNTADDAELSLSVAVQQRLVAVRKIAVYSRIGF